MAKREKKVLLSHSYPLAPAVNKFTPPPGFFFSYARSTISKEKIEGLSIG